MWLPDCWPIVGMPVVVDTKMWLVDCWPIVNMPVVVAMHVAARMLDDSKHACGS